LHLDELHVDLVRNEWDSGIQIRVAFVDVFEGRVRITPRGDSDVSEILAHPISNPDSLGCGLVSDMGPADAFTALESTFNNEYFFATQPHSIHDCAFSSVEQVRMTSIANSSSH